MFNKIANIGILKDNSSGHQQGYPAAEKAVIRRVKRKKVNKDSIVFSPAALFLTEVKWGLSGVDYSSESQIKFDFNIEELNFKLTVDFNEFYKTSHQVVWVSKDIFRKEARKRHSLKILVRKPNIRLFEKFPPFPVPGIASVFRRVEKMNIKSEFYKYESLALHSLLDGLEYEIYEDFKKIFFVIYSFIDKLDKYDLNHMYVFPNNNMDNILIEKVLVKDEH